MINVKDVLDLISKRDKASRAEQQLEAQIFDNTQRDATAAEAIGRKYRQLKDKRNELSIKVAVMFMQLSPEDKAKVNASWKPTREKKRNDRGSK